jgi:hypothetical protein
VDNLELERKLAAIDEDYLGAYFFNLGEIRIYWEAIAILGSHLGVSAELLGFVVMAHELAHAFTHLGSDIDDNRWGNKDFEDTDIRIVEGLAQFYTEIVCAKVASRFPEAIPTYHALLKRQSTIYRVHLGWKNGDEKPGEKVRAAMIKCRSNGTKDLKSFTESLELFLSQRRKSEKHGTADDDTRVQSGLFDL